MKKLNQTYFLDKKYFELTEEKILIKEKSVFHNTEFEVRYSEIGLDLVKYKNREGIGTVLIFGGLLIFSIILTINAFTDGKTDMIIAFFMLFSCVIWGSIVCWSLHEDFSSNFILQGGNNILYFFISSPNEESVKKFIEEIRKRTKNRLLDDLSTFDPDLEFQDQLENLKYLKRLDLIEQTEFERIREELRKKHLIK